MSAFKIAKLTWRDGLKIFANTFALTGVISALITICLNDFWLSRITDNKAAYLSVYYNYVNALKPTEEELGPANESLVLVNSSVYSKGHEYGRAGIARLLDTLYSLRPAIIGLDLFFPESSEVSRDEDQMLQDAVSRCKDRLVVAAWNYQDDDSLRHSFFTIPAGVDYGTANSQSFYGFSKSDRYENNEKEVDKLVVKMARKSGLLISDKELEGGIVNYSNKNLIIYNSPEFLTEESIRDKVVLVGDFNETRDIAQLPFFIEGKTSLPGTKVAAYQLNSILSPGCMIRRAGLGRTIFWNLLFLLVYSAIFVYLSIWEDELIDDGKTKRADWLLLLFKPIILILAFVVAISLCIWMVRTKQLMVDMTYFVVAEVLIIDFVCKWQMMRNNKKQMVK